MTVDADQHVWHYHRQRDTWTTKEMVVLKCGILPSDLRRELLANGFDLCIAVRPDQSEAETTFPLPMVAQAPWVAAVVGWVDLVHPRLAERLKFFAQFSQLVQIIEGHIQRHAPACLGRIFGENALRLYGVRTTAWTCN